MSAAQEEKPTSPVVPIRLGPDGEFDEFGEGGGEGGE
jgi:hypothetical protein